MYAIKMPSGNYLEGDFNFNFELNNQVFSSGDTSALGGSFTFPTDVPLSPKNKIELAHPHLVNNSKSWKTFPGVWVEVYNVPIFYGTLQIKKANAKWASIVVIASPIFEIKDVKLKDLDLGDDHLVLNWADHMYDRANAPDEYDYSFFPVWNIEHNGYPDTDPHYDERSFQNYWNVGGGAFSLNSGAITPFIRIDYVLDAIFKASSFDIVNAWQVSIELKRLYLYNNFDVRQLLGNTPDLAPDLPTRFNLKDHVPDITCREFLRKIIAHFCLGLFTNPFSGVVKLVPVQTILNRDCKYDWTGHMIGGIEIEEVGTPIKAYNYPQSFKVPPGIPRPHNVTQIKTTADLNIAILAQPDFTDVWYYTEDAHTLIHITKDASGFNVDAYVQNCGVYPYGDDETPFDTGVECLRSLRTADDGYGRYSATNKSSTWHDNERRIEEAPFCLMLYRGIQNDGSGLAPLAQNHVWLPSGSGGTKVQIVEDGASLGDAGYSLNWFGDYGLYTQFHSYWSDLINRNKPVSMKLALPVSVLTGFSFEDKVRIGSMEYFIKKLRIGKPLGAGLVYVEASMVTTI